MYNITAKRVASEVKAQLADMITAERRKAPEAERDMVDLSGQALHFALESVDDAMLVEMQAYGSLNAMTGEQVYYLSLRSQAIAGAVPTTAEAWTPDTGPFTRKAAASSSAKTGS